MCKPLHIRIYTRLYPVATSQNYSDQFNHHVHGSRNGRQLHVEHRLIQDQNTPNGTIQVFRKHQKNVGVFA